MQSIVKGQIALMATVLVKNGNLKPLFISKRQPIWLPFLFSHLFLMTVSF